MDVLASECSGGCESGWTLYLEQSQFNNVETGKRLVEEEEEEEEDEEEDLSMVSDASSGPPHHHFHEEIDQHGYFNYENNNYNNDGCFYNPAALVNNNIGGKKIRQKKNKDHQEQLPSSNNFLDDTASSPAFNFSKNNFGLTSHEASMDSVLDYSQGFSATHFESPFLQGRSAYQDHHFGNGYIQPSLPGNYQLHNNQWLKRMG